jgi:UDPglucose 6-dehydrogenase
MDRRIGAEFLKAGLGWGGSCFPKDVNALIAQAHDLGYDFTILRASSQVNDDQVANFMDRLERMTGGLEGKTVALLGLAFKPNTDDVRDAKSHAIIESLEFKGAAVSAYDPVAMKNMCSQRPGVTYSKDAYDAATGADAVVLVTEWAEFAALDLRRLATVMKGRVLLDGRRLLDPEKARAAGLDYARVGSV